LEPTDANRESCLSMINQSSHENRTPPCTCFLRSTALLCLAFLAWCPPGRTQASNPASASAEEFKQLRELVQSLQTHVTDLENELKQRQPSSTESAENNSTVSGSAHPNAAPVATEGFLMRYEWRRDFSNQRSFFTDNNGVLSKEQQTAAVGVIWWVGRKEGAW
jgi:hypothetical protein